MRIEDVGSENVRALEDQELMNLRERANQMWLANRRWRETIDKQMIGVSAPIQRDEMLESYAIICEELRNRGRAWEPKELDAKLLRKKLRAIDVAEMRPIIVREAVVSLSGHFVKSPKTADVVEVRVDADEFADEVFTQKLEKHMVGQVLAQTGRPIIVRRDADGLESPIIPVFDLMLIPRLETAYEQDVEGLRKRLGSRVADEQEDNGVSGQEAEETPVQGDSDGPTIDYISKPYPNEHSAPQEAGPFTGYARTNNKFGSGIHALYGLKGGKSKLASIRFDAKKFTAAQAKAWLKEHDFKVVLTPAKPTKKSGFLKNDEERICGGIVYSASMYEDSQGDYAEAEDIYRAMKSHMIEAGGRMKFMHAGQEIETPIIECFFADAEVVKWGEKIPAGSWYLCTYIPEDYEELCSAIKSKSINGFSMAGHADFVQEDEE